MKMKKMMKKKKKIMKTMMMIMMNTMMMMKNMMKTIMKKMTKKLKMVTRLATNKMFNIKVDSIVYIRAEPSSVNKIYSTIMTTTKQKIIKKTAMIKTLVQLIDCNQN